MKHSNEFLQYFNKLIQRISLYQLPKHSSNTVWIIPVSSGADSTALAILMHMLFRDIPFQMVFTDTEAEPEETYHSLNRLEQYLSKPLTRVQPKMGLFDLVESFNGYLPSGQSRYCTRILKLETFKEWIKQFEGRPKVLMVGIRADEDERVAFTLEDTDTEMPFVDMGIRREDVFEILRLTIGIPKYYQYRTRSGCSVCFFQRRQELVGLYQYQKIEFIRGKRYEKVAQVDLARHVEAMPLWKDTGVGANWLNLPVPTGEKPAKGSRPKRQTKDLFGNRGIFVGGEFFFDSYLGLDEFIWHQRIVSYSPTLNGIQSQLNDRYRHLLATAEVFDMTQDDVRNRVKFAIWFVEIPEEVFQPDGNVQPGYTWQSSESYAQLEHITSMVTRCLHAEGMSIMAQSTVEENTIFEEWKETSIAALNKIQAPVGQVCTSNWYQPTEAVPELTDNEIVNTVACPMCTI